MGDAVAQSDECYSVTLPAAWQNGAVWFLEPVQLNEPFQMDLRLNFGFNDQFGADGMVFVMQTVGTNLLGIPGGGMGFEGISPAFGVELDTYQNPEVGDPPDDHIALISNGNVNHFATTSLAAPVPAAGPGVNIEDGQDHLFRLTWDPAAQVVEVYFDCELRQALNIDLANEIFFGTTQVFWGFTGATGGLMNAQSVCLDQFTLGLPEDVQLCAGETVQLGVNGPEDGTYSWLPVDGVSDPGAQEPIFSPSETTSYTVTYSDLCGETQSDEVTIVVDELSVDLGPDVLLCPGEVTEIQAPDQPGATYTWNGVDGTAAYTADDTEEITLEMTVGDCTVSDEIQVTIFDEISFEPLPATIAFCSGESVELEIAAEGSTVFWEGFGTETIAVDAAGVYTAEIIHDVSGCSTSTSVVLEEVTFPEVNLPEEVAFCEGDAYTLEIAEGTGTWSTGSTGTSIQIGTPGWYWVDAANGDCIVRDSSLAILQDAPAWPLATTYWFCPGETVELTYAEPGVDVDFGAGAAALTVTEAGSYTVVLSLQSTGCSTTTDLQVNANAVPEITLPESAVFCDSEQARVRAEVVPAHAALLWDTGESDEVLETFTAGMYALTADTDCGFDEASVEVSFRPCTCFGFVPNAFSPNYDGHNDVFLPVVECAPDTYELVIFNRWGEVVFRTTDPTEAWDGSADSNSTHFGEGTVYNYVLTYSHTITGSLEQEVLKGHLVMLR